jgi:hypothetical protein
MNEKSGKDFWLNDKGWRGSGGVREGMKGTIDERI